MPNPVIQWQMLSPEPEKAAGFYGQLFGWTVHADNPLNYRQVDTGTKRGISGGIWPAPPGVRGFVQLFVEVADVAAHVAKATALGATVLIPPQTLPQGEVMAMRHDPLRGVVRAGDGGGR
jgi:predicted enzyme related to lactoylglutathione lyase